MKLWKDITERENNLKKGGDVMEVGIDVVVLEEEIQRVFKKLPRICSDTSSHLFIIQALYDAYKNLTGKDISLDY